MATFESLGPAVIMITIPDLDAIVDALTVIAAEPSALHGRWLRDHGDNYRADVRAQLEARFVLSAVDYVQAQRYRSHVRTRFAEAFRSVDALISPTLPFTAPRIGGSTIDIGGQDYDIHIANMQFTALAELAGALRALEVAIARASIAADIIAAATLELREAEAGSAAGIGTGLRLETAEQEQHLVAAGIGPDLNVAGG
jgi:aspartyl-tRNA(Asn)/glutamyl-tRNA(Gln) amidotransferase subunit A